MKEILINSNDVGNRIDKFIFKTFPNIPQALVYKYIRRKRIKINNKKCDISEKLKQGDLLSLYINDYLLECSKTKNDFLLSPTKLDIIYEDENILLINKKPGLMVHEGNENEKDSLINRIKNYLFLKKEYDPEMEISFSPALVNRIDRNTSGIVIAAKNAAALRILNQKMKLREIKKNYVCITYGVPPKKSEILHGYLEKNSAKNKVYISQKASNLKNAKNILTKYKVLEQTNNFSLLDVELLTGRTHQIRAHLASIGCPILGDGKYGINSVNRKAKYKYQALCAYKLHFEFSGKSEPLDYLNNKTFKIPYEEIWFIKDFHTHLNKLTIKTQKNAKTSP